ncbi:MAG: hypothetical protein B6D59_04205 [Campylobacteraceae bacterium 4484_4]|nr:MAG: hypothetical protein B6D59_04205 [Campylobacteraceae bacterium 4484_4]
MVKIPKTITLIYIMILGITLGASLYAGIVVAPVTFHTESFLGSEILSRYQEGVIMTANFVKLGYLVDFTLLAVIFYEGFRFKSFERDTVALLSAVIVIASGLLFTHYYIPQILEFQAKGEVATQSELFEKTHFASELDFKLFAIALMLLMGRNLYRSLRS